MKLFNKTIDRQLFKQYALGSDLSKQEVVVKIFNPSGAGSWYILNSDPQDPDYLWAIVDLGYGAEVGSVSRNDLESYRGRFGLGFERDLGFDPVNAEELYKGLRQGNFYADGGNLSRDRKFVNRSQDYEVEYSKGKNRKGYGNLSFADGGELNDFSDNQRMIMNQNVEVEHHHEELEDILEDKVPVPAWVVAKMETATQNLSDITHYLDGKKEIMEDQLEEDNDDDDDDEIQNKEVVEPINVTAETKAEMTKKFTDQALGNLKGFLKGMEGIELRDDYTFDYKDEQYEIEPIINSDQNGVSNAVFTIFDGDGEEVGEVAYSREGGKQKFTANSQFFGWDRAKFEDGGFMNNIYADGGIVDVEKVNKADEIYREHNRERKEKGIENFSKESVALWNEKYDNRLQKLKLTFEEKNALNPKKWYADGGYFDGTIPKVSAYMNTYVKGGEIAKAEVFGLKRNIMGTTDIEMRISGMRKAQDFIVYPIGKDDAGSVITIQSETRIGQINLVKGVGVMSQSHSSGAYFVHLQMDKLTPFRLSESDLENIKSNIFRTAGANVGSSIVKSDNSGASRLFNEGGEVYSHKHSKGWGEDITIELLEPTEKGWKVKQTTKKGRKTTSKTTFFSKEEINELFEKQFSKGGSIKKEMFVLVKPFSKGSNNWRFSYAYRQPNGYVDFPFDDKNEPALFTREEAEKELDFKNRTERGIPAIILPFGKKAEVSDFTSLKPKINDYEYSPFSSKDDAEADVSSYSDYYAKGGGLPSQYYYGMGTPYKRLNEEEKEDLRFNNYNFKSAKQVWGAWTVEQQQHFLKDHIENNVKHQNYIKKEGDNLMSKAFRKYEDLPTVIKAELIEHIKKGQYAKGGVTYFNNDNQHRLGRPSGSFEKEIYAKVKDRIDADDFVGSFGWKISSGKKANIADGFLYKLDDYDQNLIKNLNLKQGEKVFRYVNRTTAIGGMMPFIKINIEKALLYFPVSNDNDDIIFETRGITPLWINLIEGSFADGGFNGDIYADGGQIRVGDRYKFNWTDTEGNKGYTIREVVKQNVTSGKDFRTKVMIMKVVESSMPETVGRMEEEYKPNFKKAIERGMEISMQEGKPKLIDDDYAEGGSLSEIEISKSGKLKTNGEIEESWYNTFGEGIVNKKGKEVGVKMNDINNGIVYYQALAKDTPENREGYGWEEHNDEVGFIYKKFATIDDLERFVNKTEDKPKYILKADIKTVTVKRNGKEVTYKGADVLNGANVLAKGGDLTSKANYVAKRDVVEVELKDGSKIKPVNGYWVKKGAEPIGAEPTPTSSPKSATKVGQTYIKKGAYGWSATTNIDDFNDYDWRISTIKTSSGQLITSAKGGKSEDGDGYTTFKYKLYEDPYHTLEVSKPSRLTEKVVAEQHAKGVVKFKKFMETGMFRGGGKISNFDKLSAKVAKQYEGKPVKNQYQEEYGKYYSREEAQEVGDKVAGKVKAMQTDKKAFGGLFKNVKDLAKPKPKYPNLEGKQVPLKSGEFVMVFTQDDNTLSVMNVGKIGSGVKLRNIDISEVDMTNFKAGGQTENKKAHSGSENLKQANDLAKKIRMDGESWLDARKRAFAQLKKQNKA